MKRRLRACTALAALAALAGCAQVPPATLRAPSSSPPSVVVSEDVAYREIGSQELTADVCRSASVPGPAPVVLLLHGGGFTTGDKGDMRWLCEAVADRGMVGVALEYRLLPGNTFPAQVEDVAAAMAWTADPAIAATYGFDPARTAVIGSSAGAIIAESVGVGIGSPPVVPKAVVAFSGASDFTTAAAARGDAAPEAQKLALDYLGCGSPDDCPVAEEASPALNVTAQSSPMLIFNSSDELIPVSQAKGMSEALDAAGVAQQLVIVPGSKHGQALLDSETLPTLQSFLSEHLGA